MIIMSRNNSKINCHKQSTFLYHIKWVHNMLMSHHVCFVIAYSILLKYVVKNMTDIS